MRRLFVVFIEIALLIIVLRTPFVQYLLSDMQRHLADWLLQIEALPHQQQLGDIRQQVLKEMPTLKPYQKDYLRQITASKQDFVHFYRTYCVTDEINPNFAGTDRVVICNKAKQSQLLTQS